MKSEDSTCVACDAIPPCPPCGAHQQCQQLYPNDCQVCPSNVCVNRPTTKANTSGVVGGVIGAIVGALLVGAISYVVWKRLSKRRERTSVREERGSVVSISEPVPMTQIVLHDTMQGPPAHFYSPPPSSTLSSLSDPFETSFALPSSALWRISEDTEPSGGPVHPRPADVAERGCPFDVPQDEYPAKWGHEAIPLQPRSSLHAMSLDAPASTQTQATRATLSTACPRLVRGPVHK